jgi:hypothetical protein
MGPSRRGLARWKRAGGCAEQLARPNLAAKKGPGFKQLRIYGIYREIYRGFHGIYR